MMVKICGITRVEDAAAAVECGASAIGFVFWPGSPRFLDPYRARRIARSVPPFVTTVGVFVNQPATYVNDVAALVPLGAVQLHGDETPAFAADIHRPVLKSVGGAGSMGVDWPSPVTLLVDAVDPVKRGGTGARADWTLAAAIARRRRVVLAGGLTPANVADAVAAVRPFGIDVSSGVEAAPGIKDAAKLAALFDALSRAAGVGRGRAS
jgi:phosphoribosylanthranilate isomerase